MKPVSISDGEWKLMNLLWEKQLRTLGELVKALKKDTGWTKSTIYMMLKRLREKGAVRMEESGKLQEYYPLISREKASSNESRSFLSKVYKGSLSMMVASLLNQEALTEEEIRQLHTILDEAPGYMQGKEMRLPDSENTVMHDKGVRRMRRKDREVKEFQEILNIIDQCDTLRLGMADGKEAYIVPVSFGYSCSGDALTFYFHSATEGRKVSLMARNPLVTFEMDTAHVFVEKEKGCACTMDFASVMGKGRAELLNDMEDRMAALKLLLSHYTDRQPPIDQRTAAGTNVYKLEVMRESLCCKLHRS